MYTNTPYLAYLDAKTLRLLTINVRGKMLVADLNKFNTLTPLLLERWLQDYPLIFQRGLRTRRDIV